MCEDKIKKVIEYKANKLAQKHNIKDKKRVREILTRMIPRYYELMDIEAVEGVLGLPFEQIIRFKPDIDEALQYLSPEEAMELFENVEPELITERLTVINYLSDPLTPFYTFQELAELLEEFKCHLEKNRDYLIETGLPKVSFEKSKWLDNQLSHLYPVKLPVSIQRKRSLVKQRQAEDKGSAERDADGNLVYSYSWANVAPSLQIPVGKEHLVPLREISNYTWEEDGKLTINGYPVKLCDYEEGAYIKHLDPKIITKLEDNRAKLFDNRIRIIDTLIDCLQYSDSLKDFWKESLKILTKDFTKEEIEFYLEVDSVYEKMGVDCYLSNLYGTMIFSKLWGGITNLLSIIGYLEKESNIGTIHNTKPAILDIMPNFTNLVSYYQVIGRSDQEDIDEVLDDFNEMRKHEESFWIGFKTRVNDSIDTEFKTKIEITTLVQQKYAEDLKDLLGTFANFEVSHLRITGRFATLNEIRQMAKTRKILTNEKKKDYEIFEYLCQDEVHIPGTTPSERRNLLVINGNELWIGDSLFHLFLRFVFELKKGKGGWVYLHDLVSEGLIINEQDYRKISNLRVQIKGSLLEKDGKKFIEHGGSGRYRISTHPDFITYEKKKLLNHKDPEIRKLANKLPNV